ncbi:MAG: biopolymer transporter ExbD, partial [Planctomycetaceae bacterium]
EAAAAMPMTMKPQEFIVNINALGQFYVGGNLQTEPILAQQLRQARLNNPGNQSVVIRGDQSADWKYIARVMSLCNQADIRDYRVAVVNAETANGEEL